MALNITNLETAIVNELTDAFDVPPNAQMVKYATAMAKAIINTLKADTEVNVSYQDGQYVSTMIPNQDVTRTATGGIS